MKSIKETIIERDGISEEEADELIAMATEDLELLLDSDTNVIYTMISAEEIIQEYFGLEPDYLIELLLTN